MPQMYPLSWLSISALCVSIFILLSIFIFFEYNLKISLPSEAKLTLLPTQTQFKLLW